MDRDGFKFELLHVDRRCGARLGRLTTPRGVIDTPVFMPVGTLGTVKGLTMPMVEQAGSQIILGNTYHLFLRPGVEVIERLGGLHRFSDWHKPILTDSGGFQIFSLAKLNKVNEQQAEFASHIDGSRLELSPEGSIDIQQALGSDIAMVLDHVVQLPASLATVEDASNRTIRWAERCKNHATRADQAIFGIVQGGLDPNLRKQCASALTEIGFCGYAIGGLSVGEDAADMYRTIDATCPFLPVDRPRYLMGVGKPEDLIESILRGVDMFDCVMPTRNGRNAMGFTDTGPIKIRNRCHRLDPNPIQQDVETSYSHLSRAYLRHLFIAGEMLGPTLMSLHNIAYYHRLTRQAREAIANDSFMEFAKMRMTNWQKPLFESTQ
jgi:queuine tRNA-ribosyltransferase